MKRHHLFEFHELPYFPSVFRDLITDFLSSFLQLFNPYKAVIWRLQQAVEEAGATCILDLCSGGGQAILTVKDALDMRGESIPVVVSDRFPNKKAFEEIEKKYGREVQPIYDSVNAADVPEKLNGFRTIFTAFHHIDEDDAVNILADAVRKGQGIGIFEYTERTLPWGVYVLTVPWVVFWVNLFAKPHSWQRILFTYIIPIIPLLVCIDCAISCLRSYSLQELEELIQSIPPGIPCEGYKWEIGCIRSLKIFRITYVIGCPVKQKNAGGFG